MKMFNLSAFVNEGGHITIAQESDHQEPQIIEVSTEQVDALCDWLQTLKIDAGDLKIED